MRSEWVLNSISGQETRKNFLFTAHQNILIQSVENNLTIILVYYLEVINDTKKNIKPSEQFEPKY